MLKQFLTHSLGTIQMSDLKRKTELIRVIQQLQLPASWVIGLNHAEQADAIATAIGVLQELGEQWN